MLSLIFSRRGDAYAWFAALMMLVGVPLASLSIDVTRMMYVRGHLQTASDAACQAAVDALDVPHFITDLLILDLQMMDGSALDHLERICKEHPEMRVLVYSMRSEAVYGQRVMSLGSVVFLSKESSEDEVVRAIRRVLQGLDYMSARTELHFLEKDPEVIRDPFSQLSDREVAVMEDLLEGKGVKEISARLIRQPTTVATYKALLFDKLGVSNLIDLQALVIAHRQSQA